MTENTIPNWFTTPYSGRSGSVPVPTLMTPPQQAETIDELRRLIETQRRELHMALVQNRELHVQLRRANQRRKVADAEQALLEDAAELVLHLAAEHECEDVCLVCDLARRLRAK